MMNKYEQAMYRAFFDEMSSIEKNAMFSKISAAPVGFFKQLARGARGIVRNPAAAGTAMSKGWAGGLASAPAEAGKLGKAWSGLKGVAATQPGKAALVGGGTALAGAGGLGYALHK
jgi:hypothetical protein